MKTIRYGRLVGGWPLALLLGSGALVVGCDRSTRGTPEQRTERVAPETLPIAPQVAPPIEQQDAERSLEREDEAARSEAARGAPKPAPAERSDVEKLEGSVGAEAGSADEAREELPASGVEGLEGEVGTLSGEAEPGTFAPTAIDGRVLYGGPVLPDDARIRVSLVAIDENGLTLSEDVIRADSGPPYEFSLIMPVVKEEAARYAVRVTIEDGPQVLYSTLTPYTLDFAEASVLPVQVRAEGVGAREMP